MSINYKKDKIIKKHRNEKCKCCGKVFKIELDNDGIPYNKLCNYCRNKKTDVIHKIRIGGN